MDALTFIVIQITICLALLIGVVFVGKYLILKFTRSVFSELENVASTAGKQAATGFSNTLRTTFLSDKTKG